MQECQTSFPLRLGASRFGASERFTHKFENDLNLQVGIMVYQVASAYEAADVEHAHLAVILSCIVHTPQGKYYSDKSKYARNDVDLPNGIDQFSART